MAIARITGVAVRGLVTAVPKNEVSLSDDEAYLFDNNSAQIDRLKNTIGLDKRRIVDDQTTAADLAEAAARKLIEESKIDPATIDGLFMVTQTPDHLQPGNAVILQGKLDLSTTCACMDINLGCSGYVYGLWSVYSFMAAGGLKRVILVVGDTISKIVSKHDKALRPLFGDGVSATLLELSKDTSETVFELRSDGTGYQSLWQPGGGFRDPASPDNLVVEEQGEGIRRSRCDLHMDGADIFNFSLKVELPAVSEILSHANWSEDQVDGFIFHQANRYIVENIRRRLKLPEEKVPCDSVERFGNLSGASIPAALYDHFGNSLMTQSHKLVLSGFGVGLSWATCAIEVPPLLCNSLIDV